MSPRAVTLRGTALSYRVCDHKLKNRLEDTWEGKRAWSCTCPGYSCEKIKEKDYQCLGNCGCWILKTAFSGLRRFLPLTAYKIRTGKKSFTIKSWSDDSFLYLMVESAFEFQVSFHRVCKQNDASVISAICPHQQDGDDSHFPKLWD